MSRFEKFPEPATALVVGASGGIGRALAEALSAADRFTVLRAARHPDRCEAPDEVVPLDLEDDASIDAAAGTIAERAPELHLVLVATGLLHDEDDGVRPEKRLADLDRRVLLRHFSVNAVGPALLAARLASLLPRREHCVWGNFSARVGSIGDDRMGGWYGYRASKAAQNMFTRNIAIELGRRHRGLACIALHPGTVATDLSAPFRSSQNEGVVSPEDAAQNLLSVVDGVDAGDTGRFFAWDGEAIPW